VILFDRFSEWVTTMFRRENLNFENKQKQNKHFFSKIPTIAIIREVLNTSEILFRLMCASMRNLEKTTSLEKSTNLFFFSGGLFSDCFFKRKSTFSKKCFFLYNTFVVQNLSLFFFMLQKNKRFLTEKDKRRVLNF